MSYENFEDLNDFEGTAESLGDLEAIKTALENAEIEFEIHYTGNTTQLALNNGISFFFNKSDTLQDITVE